MIITGSAIKSWEVENGFYINRQEKIKISISANIDNGGYVNIDPGVTICRDTYIGAGVQLSSNVYINQRASIHDGTSIESGAHIGTDTSIGLSTTTSENVTIGHKASIDDNVVIDRGVSIGALAHIYKGVIINYGVFIGPETIIGAEALICPLVTIPSQFFIKSKIKVVRTPLVIYGSKHVCFWYVPNVLAIGCETATVLKWMTIYKKIGERNGYNPKEIEEYKRYIDLFAQDQCGLEWVE